jgi:hypothetical protein
MVIAEIHILASEKTPEIFLDPEGTIRIKGRGMSAMKSEQTDRIMKWIDQYVSNPADVTNVIIRLEYLNSTSTSIIYSILKKIAQVILRSKKLMVMWYYDEDDEDILERGEYIAEALNIPFEYLLTHKSQEN